MYNNDESRVRHRGLVTRSNSYAALLGYHPKNLSLKLHEEPNLNFEHPENSDGDDSQSPMALGVHALTMTRNWEVSGGGNLGILGWHAVPLSTWVATRAEVAGLDETARRRIASSMPSAFGGRYGTHLGLTMSAITSDNKVVFRSRKGRYAEEDLFDSLVAGTALLEDLPGAASTTDLLRLYLSRTNISMSRDVIGFHPTHLASRICDSGLWVGGWLQLGIPAAEVASLVPFETAEVDLRSVHSLPVRLTDWGHFDLNAMLIHAEGGEMLERIWLP